LHKQLTGSFVINIDVAANFAPLRLFVKHGFAVPVCDASMIRKDLKLVKK